MLKRILCAVLCAVILFSSFVACSETAESTDTAPSDTETAAVDESTEEATTLITDDLGDGIDYEGYECIIYNTNPESNDWYTTVFVTAEEDSAEVLNSAIYNRNLSVMERLNIKISEIAATTAQVKTAATAGDDTMTLALERGFDAIPQAQENLLYDLKTVEQIDFSKPYWDQAAYNSLDIGGKLFIGLGEFITTNKDETIVTFFNKKIITDFSLENPYELVNSGNWTLDKMQEMGKGVISDLNGDSKFNDYDRYALMSWSGVAYPFLFLGSGVTYMTLDENRKPVVTAGDEKFINVYEKIVNICHSESDNFFYDANIRTATLPGVTNNHRVQEIMFPNNQVLFWIEVVSWSKALRDMDADFGVIPSPKYDAAQENYYNYSNCNFYPVCIPISTDAERAGTIVEALNSASYYTTLPAYYDVMLKSKYSRDEESAVMLDIIFNNLVYDIGAVYNIGSLASGIYGLAANNDTDLASYVAKMSKSTGKMIDRMMDKLAALDS